jgi:RHS repeat-associated protein
VFISCFWLLYNTYITLPIGDILAQDVSYGDSTQLLYLRARYYNPADGRFQSRDMWGGNANHPMSINRWGYVEGNPVNRIDPSGHFSTLVSEQLAQVINIPVTFESTNTNKILNISNNTNSDCSSLFGIGYGEKLRSILKKRYDWNLSNSLIGVSWSDYDILTVFNTANDIEHYVDKLTSSKGRQWMRNYLGGVKMTIEKNR